jgi:DNA-binding NarL/FixJ family response regulator
MADDHAIFRDGLRKLLGLDESISLVGEAQNGEECIKLLAKLKPDVLLLDLRIPIKNGLAVLEEVNFDAIATRVVVLTAAEDDRDVVHAMRLGARGVILKQSATDVLESGPKRDKPLLSDREKQIVHHVAQGFRNKEIAEKLFISGQTVKNHLYNIFDKLGVSGRLELALYAIHHRLVEADRPAGVQRTREQEWSDRFAKAFRVVAPESSPVGLSRRLRHTHGEGTSAQLCDHHQRSPARDGASKSPVPQLGHPLCRPASLCTARLIGYRRARMKAHVAGKHPIQFS